MVISVADEAGQESLLEGRKLARGSRSVRPSVSRYWSNAAFMARHSTQALSTEAGAGTVDGGAFRNRPGALWRFRNSDEKSAQSMNDSSSERAKYR
jgi:hypothetical protein